VEDRRTRLPTEAEIADINARHLISTPIKPADLLFVFGTREDIARRVDEAVRLWREGLFRWSIVSGGVTPGSKLSECEIIKTAMVSRTNAFWKNTARPTPARTSSSRYPSSRQRLGLQISAA